MKNNITIDSKLSIHPVDGFDYLTQNSVGTKSIVARLDKWALAEGEELFIAFEKLDKSNKVDPIIMGRDVDGVFSSVVPEEVIFDDGDWEMCIYKMLNWNEETGKADSVEVGAQFAFHITSTIRDDSGKAVTKYDLINVVTTYQGYIDKVADDNVALDEKMRLINETAEYVEEVKTAAEEAQAAAEQAKAEAEELVQSTAEEIKTAAETALNGAEKARDDAEQIADTMYEVVSSATSEAQKGAEQAQARAEQFAQQAEETVNGFVDYKNRTVKFVTALPEEGEERILYAVVTDADSNLFDLYVWENGAWRHLGGENIVANGQKTYSRTLVGGFGWENNAQTLKIPALIGELGEQQEVSVYPADESAAMYVLCGITAEQSGADLIFTCRSIPNVNLKVKINVGVAYETPSASGYYTSVQTDDKIADAINGLVDGAPDTYDTFKEIAEYIVEDKSGTTELMNKVKANAAELERQKLVIEEEISTREDAAVEITVGGNKVKGLDFALDGTTLVITSRR